MRSLLRLSFALAAASAASLFAETTHAQFRQVTSLSATAQPEITAVVAGRVLFSANDGLWATDGVAYDKLVASNHPILTGQWGVGVVGGAYVFSSTSLYATKGTPATTVMLAPGAVAERAKGGDDLKVLGTRGYFNTWGGDIWTTDATPGGTMKVAAFGAPPDGYYSFFFMRAGAKDLFTSSIDDKGNTSTGVDNPANDGLWSVSGGSSSRVIAGHMVGKASCGSYAYYWASTGLWRTDGTAAGTFVIAPATFPLTARCLGSRFVAQTSDNNLLVSDGSLANTTTLAVGVSSTTVSGPFAYFVKATGAATSALWRTDGTAAGTIQLKAFPVAADAVYPQTLSFNDGRVIIPWQGGYVVTDGSVANTQSSTMQLSTSRRAFVASNGKGYFYADDGSHGCEPWVTDGTTAGTKVLQDLRPGSIGSANCGSDGEPFVEVDGELFISAGVTNATQIQALRITPAAPKDAGVDAAGADAGSKNDGGLSDSGNEGEGEGAGSGDGSADSSTTTTTSGCNVSTESDVGGSAGFVGAIFMLCAALVGVRRRR